MWLRAGSREPDGLLCYSPAVWPWASDFTSVCLGFLTGKWGHSSWVTALSCGLKELVLVKHETSVWHIRRAKYTCGGLNSAPQIHVHLEPQNVTLLADVIS